MTLIRLIADHLADRHLPSEVLPESTFSDLGLDPIEVAWLAVMIEDHFSIAISDAQLEAWTCVADVLRTVERANAAT
jgi:acyl carrier protein